MPHRLLTILNALVVLGSYSSPTLVEHAITAPDLIPAATIVGRARCNGVTWLLNDQARLVEIASRSSVQTVPVSGLRPGDRPWGLACRDGTLWTLATPRVLVSVSRTGDVSSRIPLQTPYLALFSSAGRFVGQPLRPEGLLSALAFSEAGSLDMPAPWAGLGYRRKGEREAELEANLVSCGLGDGPRLPCWFADQPSFTQSDGVTAHAVTLDSRMPSDVAMHTPIWDVALQPEGAWVLVAVPQAGRAAPEGRWLLRLGPSGAVVERVRLQHPSRSIIVATPARCVLVATDGALIEVVAQ